MWACTVGGCSETFETDDELADHLTDAHDAFSDVMFMEVGQ